MKTRIQVLLPLLSLLTLPFVVQAQFTFTTNNGAITITRYTGPGGDETIPNATNGYPVTTLADWAFAYQNSLTSITIPGSVTNIGTATFHGCSSLVAIEVDLLNPSYCTFDGVLFNRTETTLIQCPGAKTGGYTVPNIVTNIGTGAFAFCTSLTNVTLGNSVAIIGDEAFFNCTSLTNLTLPASVSTIGNSAFANCTSLIGATIPDSVTSIGNSPFSACSSLSAIEVGTFNPAYISRDGVLFTRNQTVLVQYPAAKATGYYPIPDTSTHIGVGAFAACVYLTNITIPSTVTGIGEWAFEGCTSLATATIPNSITNIGDGIFTYCTSLTNITIGTGITSIGDWAFQYCSSLTSITITKSVISIGDHAFDNCSSLSSVTVASSVTTISDQAFAFCISLRGVYFEGNAPAVSSYPFAGANDAIVYYLPGTIGWDTTFGGRPTVPWFLPQPLILTIPPGFGVQTNTLGFRISWATNIPVVVEGCTNLANPSWSSVGTNSLTGGWSFFSDPQWTNCPRHFYRIRSL